ncbi:LTA synthase family protein [Candidatus Methylobacter oryzae]|uniref:LTA synthase family protein n=1 Tax=Candidatus Methylobacter oryzae TaxID=2497749 RepID=A0ABY3CD28_9GAMM|nr:LTA synthase family protein [Candidatus Methylobacter oryzae]TRX00515.1 LTA synthase family protein [Candidatus Methylobacter oryzae]
MIKFILLLVAPLVLKGLYVDDFIYHYTTTRLLGFCQVLANDAILYSGLALLLYLSFLPQVNRLCTALLRVLAVILFAVYIIDYLIIVNFNTHLAVGDAIKYADYSYKYIQQIYGINNIGFLFIIAVIVIPLILFSFSKRKITSRRYRKIPLFIIAALPLISGFSDNQKYAHSWIYKNVIDYNLTILSESSAYSDKFLKAFNFNEQSYCSVETGKQTELSSLPDQTLLMPSGYKNIIILMVESLSTYQSQYFSGINNWTPNIDLIAGQNQAFKNFYANGFITEDGEIALLTGLQPIYPPSSYSDDGGTSFHSFFSIPNSLPNILKKYGYKTEFLTTADLEFGNTGNWARSIGFNYIEGHDQPEYDKWERFHFQAAPDEALYVRALDRVKQNNGKKFFIFIKTVSSHHPYINPENKDKSESEAIRYTDKQIGRFYQQLQAERFFDNGLLVIVGDHHSMTPLKKAEVDNYGQFKAAAKVPLIIADGVNAGVENNQYQQIDIFNSLQGMVSGRQCYTDWNGILLGEHKTPPKYIAHRRGDNRDIVSIFTENEDFLVKLDGDSTRLSGNEPAEPSIRQMLIDKVNALRIARVSG